MAKQKTIYFCQDCGNEFPKWMGQCPACGAWNSLVEELPRGDGAGTHKATLARRTASPTKPRKLSEIRSGDEDRIVTGNVELDRVLGGGIVRGSVVLVAGDPGIGKSTLMTQLGSILADRSILYVTGEESPSQVKMRAERLDVDSNEFLLLPETGVEAIIESVHDEEPDLMVVDSIQTIFRHDMQSAPGSVSQVRESAAALIQLAKGTGTATFLIGHVTKSGTIAGPRVLEHMVDTVLYLEGDRHHVFRILRAVKNRFGSTNEIGVFEMESSGLTPVGNPSALFLSNRSSESPGNAVVCSMEGSRPILAEIQALVTPTSYPNPQRTATGYDGRRLQMLLAVLEKREGLRLSDCDVFVNVAGGLKLSEPAVDLGILGAVASSFKDRPIPAKCLLVGEVGLGGEIRRVPRLGMRMNEAAKLGFERAIVPEGANDEAPAGLRVEAVSDLGDVMDALF
jgi:DNA repair protein RadA/Sms